MILDEIPMGKSSKLEIARKRYRRWRQNTKMSKIYLATLFAMCDGKCPVCDQTMVLGFSKEIGILPNSATLDHVTPISVVQEHKRFGLQIMCRSCNIKKGAKIEKKDPISK